MSARKSNHLFGKISFDLGLSRLFGKIAVDLGFFTVAESVRRFSAR